MVWIDMYINKIVTKLSLQDALAEIFEINPINIKIISYTDEVGKDDIDYTIKIICKTSKLLKNKDYKLRLEFNFDNSIIIENDIEIISKLISILKCKVLIDNYLIDPSTMLEINDIVINDEDEFFDAEGFTLP